MGTMFRSEKMVLCQIFIQSEIAYDTVSQLGEAECVQFRDLHHDVNAFQRKFVTEVRRCEEMERKINSIEDIIKYSNRSIPYDENLSPTTHRAPEIKDIWNLETNLEKYELDIRKLNENKKKLKSTYNRLTEKRQVLEMIHNFFSEVGLVNLNSRQISLQDFEQNFSALNLIVGVIEPQRRYSFERMLWRITHSKAYVKSDGLQFYLKDQITGQLLLRNVFVIIFFQGQELRSRVLKICQGFHAEIYKYPKTFDLRLKMLKNLLNAEKDLKTTIIETEVQLSLAINSILGSLSIWKTGIKKSKAIFEALNKFSINVSRNCLVAECWLPLIDLLKVQKALNDGRSDESAVEPLLTIIDTNDIPPTFYRTSVFTEGFQNLIDAYGVASYGEANPALYTIITFPFLFAVMFGDLGHGLILFVCGIWLCFWEKTLEKKSWGEIWKIFFGGRYIILLMGLFSIYTGFVYNEVFSKSINLFNSSWIIDFNSSTVQSNPKLQLNPKNPSKGTYPIGVDPIWMLAENKIIFLNTYKMKMSIIFGVIHMFFGVCMSVVNFRDFKKPANILLEFLPKIIFLGLLFGYLVFMMFFKWIQYSAKADNQADSAGCAPSILVMFINMMLFKSSKPLKGCNEFMFNGQKEVQNVFISIGIVCIPWMLLGKPLYIKFKRRQSNIINSTEEEIPADESRLLIEPFPDRELDVEDIQDNKPLSEIFIYQAIHTIEYVLSTISHTASYLRLWALSLAHAQLAEVLWKRVLSLALKSDTSLGFIMIYLIFGAWAMFTLVILVMMEGLSAFLHTLRLHWVEFMSKFYSGEGYLFKPFSFKSILKTED
ncbi:V-type proton ATPase 116 kDa subunit a 1-like [Episyrphus balteatus]|uniref:V-type proton ATPase 116 kDa subunit a 1-like n=1 Tax=Episyrphus balteatus TaxID=286459 RepID=UPI00248588D1|nr:V-type proton ATPase 116 kDa subunit a 1-like [Episyrphus balteatus]XP_055851307.1 V-type proton ATPase 116 kDa subunit a 1-like [Episyrphus balteatus]